MLYIIANVALGCQSTQSLTWHRIPGLAALVGVGIIKRWVAVIVAIVLTHEFRVALKDRWRCIKERLVKFVLCLPQVRDILDTQATVEKGIDARCSANDASKLRTAVGRTVVWVPVDRWWRGVGAEVAAVRGAWWMRRSG